MNRLLVKAKATELYEILGVELSHVPDVPETKEYSDLIEEWRGGLNDIIARVERLQRPKREQP